MAGLGSLQISHVHTAHSQRTAWQPGQRRPPNASLQGKLKGPPDVLHHPTPPPPRVSSSLRQSWWLGCSPTLLPLHKGHAQATQQ